MPHVCADCGDPIEGIYTFCKGERFCLECRPLDYRERPHGAEKGGGLISDDRKALDSRGEATDDMARDKSNEAPSDDLGMAHVNHCIVFETREGEPAAVVTIEDLGAEASPIIVEEIEKNVTEGLDHLVRDCQ